MTHTRRWIVTYTKHLKQKRKTYHDGVLELSDSGNKVLLYDDSEKLIDSRFLKKDEVIESGGTLTFEAHLVDVGSLEGKGPLENINVSRSDSKLNEKAQTLPQKEDEKSTLPRKLLHKDLSGTNCRSRENKKNISRSRPLQNHLNVITSSTKASKNELNSLRALQTHDATHTNLKEWNVLYTTQITQKAKKYHDGILQLLVCGSDMNQIILLCEDGSVLSSKYLKSVECIKTGNKCELPNHLVEICEPRTRCKENICKVHLEQAVGPCSSDSVKSTDCSRVQSNKALRDACQILRILKKPFPAEENDLRKSPVAQANASPSSDFVLLDVQNQSKDLNLQGSGNCKGDSSGCPTETSLSGTPDIRAISSEQVILTEPKLEVDSFAMTISVEGHSISDPSSFSQNGRGISSDKCCSDVGVSRELSGFLNENLPVGEPCLLNGKEDAADRLGRSCAGTLKVDQISKEDIKQEGRCGMTDVSAGMYMTCGNFESPNLSNEDLIIDGVPTFDLGF